MDFAQLMKDERTKLTTQKNELEEQLVKINAELRAIDAYEKAKTGTVTSTGTGKRRTGIRQEILSVIEACPDGITRADLLEKMDAKGDKKAEQSISNALASLKKANTVSGDEGIYRAQ